jgi:hypothetical protein
MKILITAPLRQDPEIFDAYQDGLDRLILPEGFQADRFFVVNDCPEIIPHIRNAAYIIHDTGDEYRKTDGDHLWTDANFSKMSDLRNMTIQVALRGGYDYWLSADTDLVLNPHTLEYLIAADKDIVSEVFWTKSDIGLWCNSWMYDQYNRDGRWEQWMEPGLYPVGMTGALMLCKRRVFEAGVGYARIPNIREALIGEDRHFCIRAACAGFEMWMDTHAPAEHLYTRSIFEEWKKRQNNTVHKAEMPL